MRRNHCVHRLACHMAAMLGKYEEFEGTAVGVGEKVHLPIEADVEISITRPYSLNFLKPRGPAPIDDRFDEVLQKHLTEEEFELVTKGYVLSNNVEDESLKTEALTHLIRPPQDVSVDEITTTLLHMFACSEPGDGVYEEKARAEDYFDYATHNSSSGAINLDPFMGVVGGSKYSMQAAASMAAAAGVPMLNGEPCPKSEVIKAGKKVRQVICQSFPIYLKAAYYLQHRVNRRRNHATGSGTGLTKEDGGYMKLFYGMWFDELVLGNKITFDAFMDGLDEEGLDESDIKSFEACISDETGFVYVILLAASFSRLCVEAIPDVAQVLADYAAMPVKFRGHECYFAHWTVGSGQYTTEDGNTTRHIAGYQKLCHNIQRHWNESCEGCPTCYLACMDWHDLAKLMGGMFVGDDRLRRRTKADVIPGLRWALGCDVISEIKPARSADGHGAEFLRTQFTPDNYCTREPIRVLAKLRHGNARYTEEFHAALMSACLEAGLNTKVRGVLEEMSSGSHGRALREVDVEKYRLQDNTFRLYSDVELRLYYEMSDVIAVEMAHDHVSLLK